MSIPPTCTGHGVWHTLPFRTVIRLWHLMTWTWPSTISPRVYVRSYYWDAHAGPIALHGPLEWSVRDSCGVKWRWRRYVLNNCARRDDIVPAVRDAVERGLRQRHSAGHAVPRQRQLLLHHLRRHRQRKYVRHRAIIHRAATKLCRKLQ